MRRAFVVGVVIVLSLAWMLPASAVTKTVNGSGTHWSPATVSIAKGSSVKWHATSGTHHVKAYGGNWTFNKSLSSGSTTSARKFRSKGTFKFYCTIHGSVMGGTCSGMCGKVVVT